LKLDYVLLKPFQDVLILQFGINPGFHGDTVKESAPELLILRFFRRITVEHFLIQFSGVCEEESFSLWVQGSLAVGRVVNHEIFLRKTVGKVFSQEWEYMVPGMDSGEKDTVFQFLEPEKSKEMMGFISGAPGKVKNPVDIRLSQIIQNLASVFQSQGQNNGTVDGFPFVHGFFTAVFFCGRSGLTNFRISIFSKAAAQCAGHLFTFFIISLYRNVFVEQTVVVRRTGGKGNVAMAVSAGPGVVYSGKNTVNAVLTEKYIHKYVLSKERQSADREG